MNLAEAFKSFVLQHAGGVIADVAENPALHALINHSVIDHVVSVTAGRPLPYSLWTGRPIGTPYGGAGAEPQSDYVTWQGLTDRRFSGRHLPPADDATMARLPPVEQVAALFRRERFVPSTTTSTLLCYFAQWFTDSVLRTNIDDTRLNTSNHEVDLCQIYGLTAETAALLRCRAGGELRTTSGGLYPAHLFDVHGELYPQFATLPYLLARPDGHTLEDVVLGTLQVAPEDLPGRKRGLYATGLERGNSTIVYTAISSIFVREHNRLCRMLAAAHPDWDDDRLFETARNINIVLLLKLTVNEYIQHLSGAPFKLTLDRSFAESKPWYRTNRIAIEFDLLYRWHALVPERITVQGQSYEAAQYRFNNALLEKHGAEALIAAASREPAGRMQLANSPTFLWQAELNAHRLARAHRLQSFAAYQACFGQTPAQSFEALTGDTAMAGRLAAIYPTVGDVEFAVGLFAQQHDDDVSLPATLNAMVAVDAFSQIFTNPLLASNVYGPQAFGAEGLAVIEQTGSLTELIRRNAAPGTEDLVYASFALHAAGG